MICDDCPLNNKCSATIEEREHTLFCMEKIIALREEEKND